MVIRSSASPTCATMAGAIAVCRGILSHADYSGVVPESAMEKTICAVDELSGFVIAVALVRPDKSVHNVEVSSVRKKMKDKAFAAKVSREEIAHGAERLGVPLESPHRRCHCRAASGVGPARRDRHTFRTLNQKAS